MGERGAVGATAHACRPAYASTTMPATPPSLNHDQARPSPPSTHRQRSRARSLLPQSIVAVVLQGCRIARAAPRGMPSSGATSAASRRRRSSQCRTIMSPNTRNYHGEATEAEGMEQQMWCAEGPALCSRSPESDIQGSRLPALMLCLHFDITGSLRSARTCMRSTVARRRESRSVAALPSPKSDPCSSVPEP